MLVRRLEDLLHVLRVLRNALSLGPFIKRETKGIGQKKFEQFRSVGEGEFVLLVVVCNLFNYYKEFLQTFDTAFHANRSNEVLHCRSGRRVSDLGLLVIRVHQRSLENF